MGLKDRYLAEAEERERARKAEEARRIAEEATNRRYVARRRVRAAEAKDSLLDYIQFTMPDPEHPSDPDRSAYVVGKHHAAVAKAIQTFVEGGYPGYTMLILTMPPRAGKTQLASKHLPAWYSGKFPRENIAIGTYSDEFAMDIGADIRRIMATPQHKQVFPEHGLTRGGTAKDRLQTTKGGLLVCVGMGGALTGRGAHLLILDDLIKGDKEATSKAMRDAAWNWFTKVAMTRRMGKKLVILTFTRWNSDDPIGRLTDPENEHYSARMAEGIKIIRLPAIAEEDDPLGRAPGEALWPDGPDKFDIAFLEQQRALLGPMGFAALYQQRPTVEDGVLFRRESLRFYGPEELPADLRYYCASDHAVATDQRSDYTVLVKVGVDKFGRIYLVDAWREKRTTDVVVETMLTMACAGERRPLIWWAEKGHISKSIGPFLRKRMDETGRYFNLVEVTPAGDKEQRAQSIAARIAMGHVYFPKEAPWVDKAIDELLGFPNGLHDDFVDALAYIGLGLRAQVPAAVAPPKQAPAAYGTHGWIKEQMRLQAKAERRLKLGGF